MNKTEASKQGFNKWARRYDTLFLSKYLRRLQEYSVEEIKTNKKIKKSKEGKRKMRVLDIACGTGYALSLLSPAECYGIDIASEMIAVAKEKYPQISFQEANARTLPFKKNFFDVILCTEALHHLEHVEDVFKELKRVLKKDGKIIITDVTFPQPIKFFVEIFDPGCVKIRTIKEAELLFSENRFHILKNEMKNWYSYTFVLEVNASPMKDNS